MAAILGDKCYAIESVTGKQIGVFSGHEKTVKGIQWLGNSDSCISASYDHTIRVWNVLDGTETWRNATYTGFNEGLSVSIDGRFAVSSSKETNDAGNVVQFWRLPETTLSLASQSILDASQNTRKSGSLLEKMQGKWRCIASEEIGVTFDEETIRRWDRRLTINHTNFVMTRTGGTCTGKFDVDETNNHFDFIGKGPGNSSLEWIGLVKVEGDRLTLCYRYVSDGNAQRPSTFATDTSRPNIAVCYQFQRVGKPE